MIEGDSRLAMPRMAAFRVQVLMFVRRFGIQIRFHLSILNVEPSVQEQNLLCQPVGCKYNRCVVVVQLPQERQELLLSMGPNR